jgi:hypothetical protein
VRGEYSGPRLPPESVTQLERHPTPLKTGNPQPVREYREWLTRLTLTAGQKDANALSKRLEDMSDAELAFADAWCERQIARAERKLTGMRKAEEQVTPQAAAHADA